MSLWLGDLGFWLATWGAGVFVSKGGDTIVSCAGSEAESLRCLVDASTTVLSGAAIILGGHSQVLTAKLPEQLGDILILLSDLLAHRFFF
ncbi:hypothetical protein E3Q23_03444 [Wallemia mellicola]|nr:hypothetical protein E3Q23_03444 [Wallemia mellicola]